MLTTANGIIVSPVAGTVTSLTLSFANIVSDGIEHGSLSDGNWRLAVLASGFTSTAGDPQLRRLFGDDDGNGTVNALDFAKFGNDSGRTVSSAFDFDLSGDVNAIDLAEFGNRFGLTL